MEGRENKIVQDLTEKFNEEEGEKKKRKE